MVMVIITAVRAFDVSITIMLCQQGAPDHAYTLSRVCAKPLEKPGKGRTFSVPGFNRLLNGRVKDFAFPRLDRGGCIMVQPQGDALLRHVKVN